MRHLLVIIDRKAFEERLVAYLASRPFPELARFLRQHGIPVESGTDRDQVRQLVADLIGSMSDLVLGAQSQQLLIQEAADA